MPTADNIKEVRNHLQKDCQITVRLLAEVVGISKPSSHAILHKDLGKMKTECQIGTLHSE